MVPYPDEIDVFTAPHTRMKELVDTYLKKITTTDFTDLAAISAFLPDLKRIFREFKSHENIENAIIMSKLKSRLNALSINDTAVCNCHDDNSLANVLDLVQKGCYSTDYFNYGSQLQRALQDFADRFLPHMKEEEEVFQPLLIKYFKYEELKRLKRCVLEYHEQWEKYFNKSLEVDELEERPTHPQPQIPFFTLPFEMELAVLTHVPQLELLNCRRVCRHWRDVAAHPSLWHEINITKWIWNLPKPLPDTCVCRQSSELDAENYELENNFITGFISNLLPLIGDHVHKLILSGLDGLTSLQLQTILSQCPRLQYLDVSNTNIADAAFDGLSKALITLSHLDLSGCCNITDSAIRSLGHAWKMSMSFSYECSTSALKFLSLSGCHRVTDSGLIHLMRSGFLSQLIHLDLSGCHLLTGCKLQFLVSACPNLRPENLYYCCNIHEGPFQCEANGCNNIDSPNRFCCSIKNF